MANKDCPNCNPQFPPTPDDTVYHRGTEYPEFGIKNGMPWSEILDILIRLMPAQTLNESAMVSASDVSVGNPPEFMVSEYSGCWEKASNQKGSYQLSEQAGILVFSYDFTNAVASVRASLTVNKISVIIYTTEGGVRKSHFTSEGAANAVRLEKTQFPITFNVTVNMSSSQCSDMTMYSSIILGNIPTEKRFFTFGVRGSDGNINTRYNLEQLLDMNYAKIAQLNNFAETIKGGDYLSQIALLRLQNEALLERLSQKEEFVIGEGIEKTKFSLASFMAYVLQKFKEMNEKLAKFEK